VNFLAHLHLNEGPIEERLGSMLADFVKGRMVAELPEAVRRGVMHHRQVDAFTDSHPVVFQSINRLREEWGRYSPILVDVFYDHFLAIDWETYHDQPLRQFLDDVYTSFLARRHDMPEVIRVPMDRLIASDRLMSYTTVDGIAESLDRMSRRFQRKRVDLSGAVSALEENRAGLHDDFRAFFPELVDFSRTL
jgi:acyl carrier protein phosphodiesterase